MIQNKEFTFNDKNFKFNYRPDSSDEKVFKEIFEKKCYRKPLINFDVGEGETWIDLGGHIGLFAIYAISKGAKKVIVYEADEDNFNLLKQNIELNNLQDKIIPHQVAVVDDNILGDNNTISFWKSKNPLINYRNSIHEKSRGIKITVPAIKFNSVITSDIDGLKIDIEGAEVDILTNSDSNYQNIKKLTFEFTLKSEKLSLAQTVLSEKGFILRIPPSTLNIGSKGWIDYVCHCHHSDLLQTLREFKFPTQTRKNISDSPVRGFALGQVISWAGKGEKAGYRKLISEKTKSPKFNKIYNESINYMNLYDKKFKYTSIQYNKNNQCQKHLDKNNIGESMIVGLGDYTGGELIIYDEDGNNPVKHDIRYKPLKFNGSIYPHETAPFEGERYTLVFYSIK